jgi:hypothetical protein
LKRIFLLLTVAAALGVAGPAAAGAFKGTVVGKQRGTLLVAASNGVVRAVGGSARIGARVAVSGTRVRAIGRAHRAIVRGVVVRRSAGVTFLSAASHVLVVHTARRLASTADTTTPQPGAVVQTNVAIDDQGDLEEQDEHQVGQAGNVQVQATVASVAAGSVTLTVNGQQLTINLPAGLTLPASIVGSQVTLNVSFAGGQATAEADDQNGNDDENDDEGDNGGGGGDD